MSVAEWGGKTFTMAQYPSYQEILAWDKKRRQSKYPL